MVTKPKYYQEAERLIGVKEVPGKGSNEQINELFDEVGHPAQDDATPWCAAFVGGCLVRGNKSSTGTLLARDYASDKYKDKFEKLSEPELYSIGVMKRGNSNWEGHVGFVAAFDKKTVTLLGGNQSNAVNYRVFPRSAFVGSGLGFVKPREKSTDVTKEELKKDSRQLKVTGWLEKVQLAVGAAAASTWIFFQDAYHYVQDNAGAFVLGGVCLAYFSYKAISSYTINAYREGRYLPKAHE